MIKRSWIEIDLNAIRQNYTVCRNLLDPSLEIMAVVKADAYGHGEVPVALTLQACGCRHFAVSNIEEAASLRRSGITGTILVLGYTPVESVCDLISMDITQALLNEDYAERLADKGVSAQFAIDTGMNRIGLDADDPEDCERVIRKYVSRFRLNGMFTHFCVADCEEGKDFTALQAKKFFSVADRVSDLKLPFVHCLNSAATLQHAQKGTLARLGIVLYGLKPDMSMTLPEGIRPALTWKSVISMIKTVHPGETIGYGRTYTAEKDIVVATVPTGYADGYSRALSNCGTVIIRGKKAPVIGRVCMDQLTVDISDIPEADFADEVTLIGEGLTADDVASCIGTIGYEIVCDISKRVTKIYYN